jgi:hypothetical protein
MDTKVYVEWRGTLEKWIVKYKGSIQASFGTQAVAVDWATRNFPGHAVEIERVQVRTNSPKGVRRGEWRR